MKIQLHCSECEGAVAFQSAKAPVRNGRLIGRCDGCGSVFSLQGGRLSVVELAPALGAERRWPFSIVRG